MLSLHRPAQTEGIQRPIFPAAITGDGATPCGSIARRAPVSQIGAHAERAVAGVGRPPLPTPIFEMPPSHAPATTSPIPTRIWASMVDDRSPNWSPVPG
jgi:hypothetical protein